MNSTMMIEQVETPHPEWENVVRQGLYQYNRSQTGSREVHRLTLLARDPQGQITGGLLGESIWGWLLIETLWVAEAVRGQGVGSQLIARAETIALERGCEHITLETFSFQALPFYQKHGYTVYGQLDGFPPGQTRYSLKKDLKPDTPARLNDAQYHTAMYHYNTPAPMQTDEYTAALYNIIIDLLNRRELEDLLQRIVNYAASILDAPYGEIMLIEQDELIVRAFTANQPNLMGDRVKRGEALVSWRAFDTREPVLIDDYFNWSGKRVIYDDAQLQAVADFPVLLGDTCLGVLAMARTQPDYPFSQIDANRGMQFAQLVAVVIDSVTLYNTAQEKIAERERAHATLRALYEVIATSAEGVDGQLYEALKLGTQLLGMDLGIISKIEGDRYTVLHCYSPDDAVQPGQIFDLQETYCDLTFKADDLITIEDIVHSQYRGHPCYAATGLAAYIGIPLQVQGIRFGTLNFSSPTARSNPFDAVDQDVFILMGKWVSAVLGREFAEQAMRTSEANLLSLINSSPAMIVRADRDCYIQFIRVPGIPLDAIETLTGQNFLNFMPEAQHDTVKRAMSRVFDEAVSVEYEVIGIDPQSGNPHWYVTNAAPMFQDGRVTSALLVNTDITEIKQAQEQIQHQNEALVKANRDLGVARKQAEAASKLKSQFLASMSHELRTPLNAIIGYAQLQLTGLTGAMTKEQLGFQDRILVNARHLLSLINEVLDLSKIEAGRMELVDKPFNLRECLTEIELQNRVLAENKKLEFHLTIDERLPETIVGDQGRIRQVIINLISNAIKFTDQGSVLIDTVLHDNTSWRISVSDTGVGIPAHLQQVIFDEFRQIDDGMHRGGTGLGLAISRKLVLMMGGTLRVQSDVGQGSIFMITLPLVTATTTSLTQ